MNRLESKSVVITGAASGIGRAAAQLMAAEGAKVLVADLDPARAEEAAVAIRETGGNALGFGVDVMNEDSLAAMIEKAVAEFGGINVLCNHVGGSNPRKDLDLLRMDLDEWDRVMSLNVRSTVVASRLAIPHMNSAGGGSIVNTASVGGLIGDSLQSAYGSAKAAVIRLTQYIAVQYGANGVRCNAVAPGAIMTPALVDNIPADVIDGMKQANALPYLGEPEDIAHAMVYLAPDESRYMTGQTLVVDGGLTSKSPLATGPPPTAGAGAQNLDGSLTVVVVAEGEEVQVSLAPGAHMHVADIGAAGGEIADHLDQHVTDQMLGGTALVEERADGRHYLGGSAQSSGAQFCRSVRRHDPVEFIPLSRIHGSGELEDGAGDLAFVEKSGDVDAHAVRLS
eukprot:gene15732-18690_t